MFFDFFRKCVTCSSIIVTISASQTSGMPNDSVGVGSTNLHKNVYVHEQTLVYGFRRFIPTGSRVFPNNVKG